MAFSTTFSGRSLCTVHNARVTSATQRSALLTSLTCNTRRRAVVVRATPDGYAVTGSSKNTRSDSSSNIRIDNDGKASNVADPKGFRFTENFRLREFLLPTTSEETAKNFVLQAETAIERAIFDFRFLTLFAIAGSLAGSLLCFLNGCMYIVEAFKVYWTSCIKGIHTGQMVLRLVEAVDVYLAGTVMLIFGMGLYELFVSNVPRNVPPNEDRALLSSSLFGMFTLKERPRWMRISSLDELKTKVGHVIVMILLVKMFERSKTVAITSGLDLLSYSVCIFLSSASLFVLHNLHK
uniref:TSA: Wollemia nobilis Ref_Wollemi_Transcript_29334_1444 transcribed RNA sequence n=1 Tax=Wollemia nobilis TaxID=56998 RepID=A0A0C9RPG3_9CONI